MLLTAIREAVRDVYTTETFTDDQLDRRIANAVSWYSRWNPEIVEYAFDTVADQQYYTLPAACMQNYIERVEYWPSGGISLELNAADEYAFEYPSEYTYDLYSERIMDDIKQQQYIRRIIGYYSIDNNQICLRPVPSDSDTEVTIYYGAVHVTSGVGVLETYATIPAEDLGVIRDLTLADIIQGKGVMFSVEPNYAEGLQRTTKSNIPKNVEATVRTLRAECQQKYTRNMVGT